LYIRTYPAILIFFQSIETYQ